MQSGQSDRKLNARYFARYVVRLRGRHDIDCTARFGSSKLSPHLLRPVSASCIYCKYSITYRFFTFHVVKWYIFCFLVSIFLCTLCTLPLLMAENREYAVNSVEMGIHLTLFVKQVPEVRFYQEMILSKQTGGPRECLLIFGAAGVNEAVS